MESTFKEVLDFLIRIFFDLFNLTLLLRFILQIVRADFYNPISQFILKVTNWLVLPLRRFVPSLWGLDTACLMALIIVNTIKFLLIYGLVYSMTPNFFGVVLLALADIAKQALNLYFWVLIIQVILSWVQAGNYNPVFDVFHLLTEPVLRPIRRYMPAIGGLDFSILVALILLQLLEIIVIKNFTSFAMMVNMGVIG